MFSYPLALTDQVPLANLASAAQLEISSAQGGSPRMLKHICEQQSCPDPSKITPIAPRKKKKVPQDTGYHQYQLGSTVSLLDATCVC